MGIKCPKCQSNNPDTQQYCGECGTQLISLEEIPASPTKTLETPTEELTTGSTFAGRYQIIEELGRGGMGKVYKALDTEIKEKVALKLLKPEIASDESTIVRFRNELKIARRVSHKHVCRMYDIGREEEKYFITMEYVEGEDLKSHIRKKGLLPIDEAIGITKQICEGLVEAHRLGVVHRDLKPQNIMIDKQGDAKVMDFGIARSVEAAGVTQTGVMIGTPDYISPEQAEGEEADQRSDIYLLGVIIYEMVTGSVPFRGDTALSVALKHKAQLPQDPKKQNPEISENLNLLILVCMEKDRKRRYQTAAELLDDLKNIEEGFPLGTKIRPRRETFVAALIRKKLSVPALIVALAIIAVVVWQLLPKAPNITSIAVLPLEDKSPNKDREDFCDGLVEELIRRLTNIESLRVPAKTSSFFFKGKGSSIQEIGKALNVNIILGGTLQKAGNKLRINVHLVNVVDGYTIWSEKYERDEEDIFALQDDISLAIVDNLKIKLLGEERAKLVKRHTENPEAYNLYVKGRFFWNKRTEEGFQKALEYFQQAIEKDPNYALAYSGIADCHILIGWYYYLPPKNEFPKAKAAAEKALEIDEGLAEAHTSLGGINLFYYWDWLTAEREFKRAIELKPGYSTAHFWYSVYLSAMGRHDEAIAEAKRAVEFDPLSLMINTNLGCEFYFARQFDKALVQHQKTKDLDPNFLPIHIWSTLAYAAKGMYDQAIIEAKKAIDLSGGRNIELLGFIYSLSGKRNEAKRVLEDLFKISEQKYVSSYRVAVIYMGLGERDKAFEWLEKAYEERDNQMNYLKVEPMLDSLRKDPRFNALLMKMNLE
jgi:serine/threonine-protein kinase